MHEDWHRNAVIYQIDPSLFRDSNGDGRGDLRGVADRLDHLRALGANCIWLLPFYKSPFRDAGYDVSDHLSVDPRFGDIADFIHLMERAEELQLRVLIELVVQHTSVDHPWFQHARSHRDSPYRDWFLWSDEPVEVEGVEPIFPGIEDSIWTWDEQAGQYYRHVFYSHQPDLNVANPAVRAEIARIMAYWLRLGIAGFRVDAVPHMVEVARAADPRKDGLWILDDMRDVIARRNPDAVLMGETDVPVSKYDEYFGNGQRLNLLLDFWVNNHLFLALARGEGEPLARALTERKPPPPHSRFGVWLRNHDELDLEQLSPQEREEVMAAFAPDDDMRIYGRGIRRRLAPMLGGDDARIAMAHALMLSLPGVPILRYGEEIGMGDDLSLPERRSVRTPMQWSDTRNGGFSSADAGDLVAPPISDGAFGYPARNVEAEMPQPDSLLGRTIAMVGCRLGIREMGCPYRLARFECRPVFGVRYDDEEGGSVVVALINLGGEPVEFALREDDLLELVDVLRDRDYPTPEGKPPRIALGPYGYRWMRRKQRE